MKRGGSTRRIRPRRGAGRRIGRRLAPGLVLAAVLAAVGLLLFAPADALGMSDCNRIQVESRDRGATLGSYVVSEPEYVAKIRALIEANGEDGSWTVSAGELGSVGYTVTYSCLP